MLIAILWLATSSRLRAVSLRSLLAACEQRRHGRSGPGHDVPSDLRQTNPVLDFFSRRSTSHRVVLLIGGLLFTVISAAFLIEDGYIAAEGPFLALGLFWVGTGLRRPRALPRHRRDDPR
jgi:hypothetical protein